MICSSTRSPGSDDDAVDLLAEGFVDSGQLVGDPIEHTVDIAQTAAKGLRLNLGEMTVGIYLADGILRTLRPALRGGSSGFPIPREPGFGRHP